MKQIWNSALATLRASLASENYERFFGRLRFDTATTDTLQLAVDDEFLMDWISVHYHEHLVSIVSHAAGFPVKITLRVVPNPQATVDLPVTDDDGIETSDSMMTVTVPARTAERPTLEGSSGEVRFQEFPLNPAYTFDAFVVGPSNQFAYAACESVSMHPAGAYNPLFIYGGTGLGKTHLLYAIAHRIREKNPKARIVYVTAEEFTNQLIKGIQGRSMEAFRDRYRTHADVLLMDDVHNLAGKERTQEEFFHTFNALHQANKQIILTSDKFPQDIPKLEERLRSRFNWGLIADVTAPELETRVAILENKASRDGLSLPGEVAFFLAHRARTNVRELEGALTRVLAYASLNHRPLTKNIAAEALQNFGLETERTPTAEVILRAVADYFDVKIADLRGPRRHRNIAHPRCVAMYLCRKHSQASFPQIGECFGGKDHTTVMHACKKMENALAADPAMRALVQSIERKLTA